MAIRRSQKPKPALRIGIADPAITREISGSPDRSPDLQIDRQIITSLD
jgi:hypothetical protein